MTLSEFIQQVSKADPPAILETLQQVDRDIERVRSEQPPIACSAGCTACCYQPVGSRLDEARAVLVEVHRLEGPAGVRDVVERSRKVASLVFRTGVTDPGAYMHRVRKPCPLLRGGLCRAYAARPAACRTHASPDRRACDGDLERGRAGQAGVPHEGFTAMHNAAGAVLLPYYERFPTEALLLPSAIDQLSQKGFHWTPPPRALVVDPYHRDLTKDLPVKAA